MADISLETSRMQRFREQGLKWALAPAALAILYIFFAAFGRGYLGREHRPVPKRGH